jgi:thiamine monophosphate synthase
VERAADVAAAGASGIAAIGLFAASADLGRTVAELRRPFDT